jgi:catechol 2,3-dioxygenase-like lactoylglutathione lyase family enzyme
VDWNSVNVNNIALNKKTDMDKAVKFYTEILGLKLISRSDVMIMQCYKLLVNYSIESTSTLPTARQM